MSKQQQTSSSARNDSPQLMRVITLHVLLTLSLRARVNMSPIGPPPALSDTASLPFGCFSARGTRAGQAPPDLLLHLATSRGDKKLVTEL